MQVPVGFIPELLSGVSDDDDVITVPYMTISFEYGPHNPGVERRSSNDPVRDVFAEHRTPPRCVTQDCFEQDTWLGVSELNHPGKHIVFNMMHAAFKMMNFVSSCTLPLP